MTHFSYPDRDTEQRIEGYLALMARRPEMFRHGAMPLVLDRQRLLAFEAESGRKVGLVYENPKYHYILVDVIDAPKPFAYLRVLPYADAAGTVILPLWRDETGTEHFGLIKLFRHAFRDFALELPRGHLEQGLVPEENAVKELREELGAGGLSVKKTTLLGTNYADSGLAAGQVYLYLAELTGPRPEASVGHEGITEGIWLTKQQLLDALRDGRITDGMTQTAVLMYLLKE